MQELLQNVRLVPIEHYIWLSSLLFCIGVMGVLLRRNTIVMFMSIELMLNAVNLLFVAFSAYANKPEGEVFVFFVMVVAAAEVAVGLGLLVMIYRNQNTTDSEALQTLKW